MKVSEVQEFTKYLSSSYQTKKVRSDCQRQKIDLTNVVNINCLSDDSNWTMVMVMIE